MVRNIIKLAFSYLRYYKKQTAALLVGVVLSAALLTGIGSLLYSGRIADRERMRSIYGDAHYVFRMEGGNFDELEKHREEEGFSVEKTGLLAVRKVVEAPYRVSFVYGDESYREMFQRTVIEGAYPEKPGEVALSRQTIRNLELDDTLGNTVVIDGETMTLCGILADQWDETMTDMLAFVSADTAWEDAEGQEMRLYVKFDESRKVFSQMESFAAYFHYDKKQVHQVSGLLSYVGGSRTEGALSIILTGLRLPEGKIPYIWGQLNEEYGISEKLILLLLCLFAAFVIYSLFQVSVRKRMAQYSTMQVLGMEERDTCGVLWTELGLVLLCGYPAGALLGNGTAWLLYSRIGGIFVDQTIGSMSGGTHVSGIRQVAEQITVQAGIFHVSWSVLAGGFLFLLVLLFAVSRRLVCRMRQFTWRELMQQDEGISKKRDRRIYSRRRTHMIGVLSRKFMFERKGIFLSMLFFLSMGGVLFLGTTYVVWNTRIHNELTFKADDGLGSDIQVYEDSHCLSDMIPQGAVTELEQVADIREVHPVRYLLGELQLGQGTFLWPEYYPETAGEEGWEQDPLIMERYHGMITRQSQGEYRLKTNVYGYSDNMLEELSDYLLEGTIDPQKLRRENAVILKTLMDGQGNYDGLAISPGDTIRLKVPAVLDEEEALTFDGPGEWYEEKEFTVAAVVSRPLAKTDAYIGDDGMSTVDLIMTNDQI